MPVRGRNGHDFEGGDVGRARDVWAHAQVFPVLIDLTGDVPRQDIRAVGDCFLSVIDLVLIAFFLKALRACCGIEFMGAASNVHDISRFGAEVIRFSPRQADMLVVAGTVTHKMVPVLQRIWNQMLEPKWSIAFGVCASSGGFYDNYSVVQGEQSKHKKKLRHVLLGTSAEDLTCWLDGFPQLKKYTAKFTGVTGARICATMTEVDLEDLGIA